MLRLNLMSRSQADDLVRYLRGRLKVLVAKPEKGRRRRTPDAITQEKIAEETGLSTATISDLVNDKVERMRLANVETIAGYLKMTLLDALQAALAQASPATAGAERLREKAMARLTGLLSDEAIALVRGTNPPPGVIFVEFDWVKTAIDLELGERIRAAVAPRLLPPSPQQDEASKVVSEAKRKKKRGKPADVA